VGGGADQSGQNFGAGDLGRVKRTYAAGVSLRVGESWRFPPRCFCVSRTAGAMLTAEGITLTFDLSCSGGRLFAGVFFFNGVFVSCRMQRSNNMGHPYIRRSTTGVAHAGDEFPLVWAGSLPVRRARRAHWQAAAGVVFGTLACFWRVDDRARGAAQTAPAPEDLAPRRAVDVATAPARIAGQIGRPQRGSCAVKRLCNSGYFGAARVRIGVFPRRASCQRTACTPVDPYSRRNPWTTTSNIAEQNGVVAGCHMGVRRH